jgi:hypothetical protein
MRNEERQNSAKKPAPKLTDVERHKRFVDMAHEVGASEDPKDFDKAFKKVTETKEPKPIRRP